MVARLFGQGLIDEDDFAVKSMRASLEDPNSDMIPVFFQDVRILTAAQWAIHSYERPYQKMKQLQPDANEQHTFKSSYVEGQDVFSEKRWRIWKEQLRLVAKEAEGVPDETVAHVPSMALQALNAMKYAESHYIGCDSGSGEDSQGNESSKSDGANAPTSDSGSREDSERNESNKSDDVDAPKSDETRESGNGNGEE